MRIETDRLLIRSYTLNDVADHAALVSDPAVMRYLGGEPRTAEFAHDYVVDCMERDRASGASRYVVADRVSGEFIGFCGFKILEFDDAPGWVDFGWSYNQRFWRQGIGMESARTLQDYGKHELGLKGIEIRTHVENSGTLRIIEQLGYGWVENYETPAGTFRRFVEPD